MTAIGERVLLRWDGTPNHDGLTRAMLDRALTLGWITQSDHDTRVG